MSSDYTYRVLIIIPAAKLAAMNAAAAAYFDPLGGQFTFTVPLLSSGVATHYACESSARQQSFAVLAQLAGSNSDCTMWVSGEPTEDAESAFAGLGNVTVGDYVAGDVFKSLGISRPNLLGS